MTERLYKGPRQMKTEFRVRPIRIFPSLKNAQNRGPRVMDSRPQNRRSSEFFAVFAFFSCFLIKKIFFCVILRKNFTSTFFRWWLSDKMKNSTTMSISIDLSSSGGKDFAIFGAQNWKSGRRSCSYSWNLKRSRRPSGCVDAYVNGLVGTILKVKWIFYKIHFS